MYQNKPSSFDNSITVTPIKVDLETETSSVTSTIGGAKPKGSGRTAKPPRTTAVRRPPPTLDNFWPTILSDVRNIQKVDAKHQALPLARIKKIMKLDDNAKMIAAEAPLLFAKACEYFIQELTMRAWLHTEESKRRTLQRSDIAQAIAHYDQFDFLIDIVPREDIKPTVPTTSQKKDTAQSTSNATASNASLKNEVNETITSNAPSNAGVTLNTAKPEQTEMLSYGIIPPEALTAAANAQVQHQHQPAAHPQLQIIQQPAPAAHPQPMQYIITIPGAQGQPQLVQQLQLQQQLPNGLGINIVPAAQPQQLILTTGPNGQLTATPAPIQQQQQATLIQNLAAAQQQQQQQQQQSQQHFQLLQQVVTPTGELTNVPITINANQLNQLRLQFQQQQQQQQVANATNIYLTTGQAAAAAQQANAMNADRNLGSGGTPTYRPNC